MRVFLISFALSLVGAGVFVWATPPGLAGGAAPPLAEGPAAHETDSGVVPGQIVVRFKKDASAAAVKQLNDRYGADVADAGWRTRTQTLALDSDADVGDALTAYRNSPLVAEAGRSHVVRVADAPNDTNYSYQWHLHNTTGGMWAEGAWDLAPNRGAGVVVAVIDTGVAYENFTGPGGLGTQTFVQAPDLAGATFVAPWDFFNNDAHANDDHGHGTHVTGTIRQTTNDGYGVAGVAHQATIMPIKILGWDGTGSDADLNEAIYYAVDNGADVINMSLAFPGTGSPDGKGKVCKEIVGLNDALGYAQKHGVVVVAAAGNEGVDPVSCPAAHPSVVAVGATRFDGQVPSYSNRGSALDITAPGGDTVDQNGDGFSDGVVQETYCQEWFWMLFSGQYSGFCDIFLQGTSMASPHVAGTAALLLGENPGLTRSQVRELLLSTARDRGTEGWDSIYGWGALDARAALEALDPPKENTPTPTKTPTPEDATPTSTSTAGPSPTPSNTPTHTPTPTSTNTPTNTPTATPTPTPTNTPTNTATSTPTNTPVPTDPPPTRLNGTIVKGSGNPVYWLDDGEKRHIGSLAIFQSWGLASDQIVQIPDAELAGYPDGDKVGFRAGKLVRNRSTGAIYFVTNDSDWMLGVKHHIGSMAALNQCFPGLVRVNVPPADLDVHPNGAQITGCSGSRPNGTLVKGSGSAVYLLANGTKRWVVSLGAFQSWDFTGDVVTIPNAELNSYPTGTDLGFRPGRLYSQSMISYHFVTNDGDIGRGDRSAMTLLSVSCLLSGLQAGVLPPELLATHPAGPSIDLTSC